MNIACPECSMVYRIDPDRVPEGGATTRCRECETLFRVEPGLETPEPGSMVTAPRVEESAETTPEPAGGSGDAPDTATEEVRPELDREELDREEDEETAPTVRGAPAFGPQDPETRAQRLARALVSDIKVYHPEKWEASAEKGTLRTDFREEILKSWEEYVEQVGEEMAKKTPFFRDALNDILAQGDRLF